MDYACACCNQLTRDEPQSNGDYIICHVCFWEDDPIQNTDAYYCGGANVVSLNEAKENYRKFGASEERFIKYVRKPNILEKNDEE
ncbi:CPCC family cysteine-rich protein [uncultured Acinetobacter sp.]|uniref:CPCC family cysteine-rich protein n=1 Tax=uncultured Acinetobacter sp. TaxID=165433 RepID=UPI0025F5096B|nr:CPCC family cysteine-rich protein [uncultured Acinetobacter sp.]